MQLNKSAIKIRTKILLKPEAQFPKQQKSLQVFFHRKFIAYR